MKIFRGFAKIIVANLAVLLVIMLLPIFLVTDDISIMDQLINYLFSTKD